MNSISATELVRNLSAVVDEVRVTGHSLSITKGKRVIATLSPPPKVGLSHKEFLSFLDSMQSLNSDESMTDDLALIRRQATMPGTPWE